MSTFDYHLDKVPEHGALHESQPPPVDTYSNTEALFAAELARLSMKERDEVLQDIHGVSGLQEEDPAFVRQSLKDLEEAIMLIPEMDKVAYTRAKNQNESYVKNETFVLMFLRANSFDIKASADRMVGFFELKQQLFGPDLLTKEITMDHLSDTDKVCLESGYAQILSGRDRAGRVIFCLMPTIRRYKTLQNRLRAAYLLIMHALRDVETQRRGIVGVAYNVGSEYTQDREAVFRMAQLVGTLPTNFKGVHYCYDNARVKMLFSIAMFVWERSTRIRCRSHCGTHMECVYNLMTFGIPADILPMTPTGEIRLEAHHEFVRRVEAHGAEKEDKVQRIVIPGTYDVLLGRGKPLQKHQGNLRYHHIIETYHEQYEKEQKLGKTNLARLIVHRIKEGGGRFLKQDKIGWSEIDDDTARYKVSHTFRNHRIAARTQEKKKAAETRKHYEDTSDTSIHEDLAGMKTTMALDLKRRKLISQVKAV